MKPKQLITLIVVFAVLLAVGLFVKKKPPQLKLSEEVQLARLSKGDLVSSDVARIELYLGAKMDSKVLLERKGGKWAVTSRFNSPGKETKINDFVRKVLDLEGEKRAESGPVLEDFGLSDKTALHVAFFKEKSTAPDFDLLVGKTVGRTGQNCFVRRASGDAVLEVNANLRGDAGLWGEEGEKTPESSEWVDTTIANLDKSKIEKVALQWPDHQVAFARVEKNAQSQSAENAQTPAKEKEYEWKVESGGPLIEPKKNGVEDLLTALSSFSGTETVDPAQKKDWGLDKPDYKCAVTMDGGKKSFVLLASRPKAGEDTYVCREDAPDVIYKATSWQFEKIWKMGRELFDLAGPAANVGNLISLTLNGPKGSIQFQREKPEEEWKVASPATGLKPKAQTISEAAGALSWTPEDYADGDPEKADVLARAQYHAYWKDTQGKTGFFDLGDEARTCKGRYARVGGLKQVLVMKSDQLEKVFKPLKDFVDLDVFSAAPADITKVEIAGKGPTVVLSRAKTDAPWQLTANGTEIPPNREGIEALLGRFSPLHVDDVLYKADETAGKGDKISLTSAKGNHAVAFGAEKDGLIAVLIDDKPALSAIEKGRIEVFVPALKSLASLGLVNLDRGKIKGIQIAPAGKNPATLALENNSWKTIQGEKVLPTNEGQASKLVETLAALGAEDVAPGGEAKTAKVKISITPIDGKTVRIELRSGAQGKVTARVEGINAEYTLAADKAWLADVDADWLKAPASAPASQAATMPDK